MLLRIESTRTPIVMRIVLTTVLVSSVIASLMNPVNPIAWLLGIAGVALGLSIARDSADDRQAWSEVTGLVGQHVESALHPPAVDS